MLGKAWNCLPHDIRLEACTNSCKRKLKTVYLNDITARVLERFHSTFLCFFLTVNVLLFLSFICPAAGQSLTVSP